ncbi:endochitinase [Ordospora colligata]|uniref:Endochitinase n=1 Tax=Ordospora colligata OC4 TaxID=1354746 RepID=A0A0B2UM50_9MICR|nr:endochitinase [Ordospora colligata OC4]KHN70329.1 endochitinase [Ordospora colligata OC4]TBU16873.1 endochitinase [Ordospora colligata]TBU19422.1 endochitinase [Ordospora colligata]
MLLLLLTGLALVNAKNSCVPGSAECAGNTLRVCGMNKQWAVIDCPEDTKCKVLGENVTCASNSKDADGLHKKHDIDSRLSDQDPDSDIANQDNEHVDANPEHEKNKSNNGNIDNDDNQTTTKENEHHDESHESTKPEDDTNNRDNDTQQPVRSGRLRTKRNASPRLRNNAKTITRTINNGGESSTVTITRMIVQKQAPSEIKLEYVSNQIEPSVKPIDASASSQPSLPSSQSKENVAEPLATNVSAPKSTGLMNQQPATSTPSTSSQQPSTSTSGQQPSTATPAQSTSNTNASQPIPSSPNSSTVNNTTNTSQPAQNTSNAGSTNTNGSSQPAQNTSNAGSTNTSQPASDKSNGTSGSKPSVPSSGGNVNITSEKLIEALTKLSFAPNPQFVDAVISRVNSKFTDMNSAVMFLAQCAHESGGYQYIEEIACAGGTGCAGQYGTGAPGKSYHGRGFIQLSWPDNYKAASQALGLGEDLYNDPDKVAQDPNLGADVSIYFWEANVANAPGVKENHFGASTKAINGSLECTGSNLDKSKRRFEIYTALVEAFGVSDPADESGCYN